MKYDLFTELQAKDFGITSEVANQIVEILSDFEIKPGFAESHQGNMLFLQKSIILPDPNYTEIVLDIAYDIKNKNLENIYINSTFTNGSSNSIHICFDSIGLQKALINGVGIYLRNEDLIEFYDQKAIDTIISLNSDPEREMFLSNGIKPDETFTKVLIAMEINSAIKKGLDIMANKKSR